MSVRIRLHGLCAVAQRDEAFEVFILPGGGTGVHNTGHSHGAAQQDPAVAHEATLSVRLEFVNLKKSSFWEPDVIATDIDGHQIGVWKIPHGTLMTTSASKPNYEGWIDRSETVDLTKYHTGMASKTVLEAVTAIKGLSLLQMQGGKLGTFGRRELKLVSAGKEYPACYSNALEWTCATSPVVLRRSNGDDLQLKAGAQASITNIARVPGSEGLTHVAHYYDLLTTPVASKDQIELFSVTADDPVYDCVPPGGVFPLP